MYIRDRQSLINTSADCSAVVGFVSEIIKFYWKKRKEMKWGKTLIGQSTPFSLLSCPVKTLRIQKSTNVVNYRQLEWDFVHLPSEKSRSSKNHPKLHSHFVLLSLGYTLYKKISALMHPYPSFYFPLDLRNPPFPTKPPTRHAFITFCLSLSTCFKLASRISTASFKLAFCSLVYTRSQCIQPSF